MSRNLLAGRLKSLVADSMMERRPISADGRRLEYILTPMGEDLVTTIVAIRPWGDRWLFEAKFHPANMFDGAKLRELKFRSTKGRRVTRTDIRLRRARIGSSLR